jgi:hypothetical protein
VSDVAVSIGLLSCGIVVVEVTTKKGQPLSEVQDIVEAKVRGTSLDHEDLALRKISGKTGSQNTASSATAYNDVVIGGAGRGGKRLGSHVEDDSRCM